MLSITLAQVKADITPKLKGTSIREVKDFYGAATRAANRITTRIHPEETRRTVTMTTPFFDNVQDYAMVTDYKKMIDIRPTAGRQNQPGLSNFSQTTPRQFDQNLDPNSFSIRWNNMVRSLRAQQLPMGNVTMLDSFDSTTSNGLWTASGDISGLYSEPLNYIEGNGSLGFNISGVTGTGYIVNSTASVTDLSALLNEDSSMIYFWIPSGKSSLFTSFTLARGESASAYRSVTVTTKGDGTAFSDGWNFLLFNWQNGTNTGSPTNTLNSYRKFTVNTTAGTAVTGCLIDNWTNALGNLYEIEYYSEYMFRTSAGAWISTPTLDTDLVNVGPALYEIFLTEMMVEITGIIRTGATKQAELAELRLELNGQPESRYVKNPQFKGLYSDYMNMFPSSEIITRTQTYEFDV